MIPLVSLSEVIKSRKYKHDYFLKQELSSCYMYEYHKYKVKEMLDKLEKIDSKLSGRNLALKDAFHNGWEEKASRNASSKSGKNINLPREDLVKGK